MTAPTLFDEQAAMPPADPTAPVFEVVVFGTPGPQGSKSFKGFAKSGRAIMTESSKKVKPWRLAVLDAALKIVGRCDTAGCDIPDCDGLRDGFPIDAPLVARVVFTLAKPKSRPKTKVTYPDTYPDVSKLLRSTEDALSRTVWRDDARLVDFTRLAKVFPGEDPEALPTPGVRLTVWRRSAS